MTADRNRDGVRVRFAPSPTGHLHVGGARTALFNYLFARKQGGSFILRIEDTDRERSSAEMTAGIIDGLAWLGLDPDEGPYFQSERGALYEQFAGRLLDGGWAYHCYAPHELIEAERDAAQKAGASYNARFARQWNADNADRRKAEGVRPVLRFRVPEGETVVQDRIVGPVRFSNEEIEDFILLRSDGSPTYHTGVVADDADLAVTHVIRGVDHLTNTPKQVLLYQAAGLEPPVFAHLPLILGEDRKRLSKRHGATSVMEFRREGYLPETMFNFLALLCWSPGEDREIFSREEAVELFALEDVTSSDAVFDMKKLEWMNGQYFSRMSGEQLIPLVKPVLEAEGLWDEALEGERRAWLAGLLELLAERSRRLPDFAAQARPYLSDDFEYDEKARGKHLRHEGLAGQLNALAGEFETRASAAFTAQETEQLLRDTAERLEIKAAVLIHATRVAVLGQAVSPGIFDVLEKIGKARSVARLRRLAGMLSD
jgi:glutamyl-tRNA synthetase